MTQFLILGGGSAGCVLATRLSEDANNHVTLIEAGRNLTAETMPSSIRSRYPGRAYLEAANIWPDLVALLGAPGGRTEGRAPRRYEQGRVLGGGSAVNAMVANRGAPGDYDEWGAAGAEGWSWDACLPYFRKLERDVDFDGPFHGKDGPIPVRRISEEAMSPFVKAMRRTLIAQGYVHRPDQNGEWRDGIFTGAVAVSDDGHRVPTSLAYLTPEVRQRSNLRVVTDARVDRIVFDGMRAVGAATFNEAGEAQTWQAQEVIVSAGAIHTPALLQRSGVGPAASLQALGIPVVLDSLGVGRNLMEHPSTAVSTFLPPAARLRNLDEHHDHAILRFSSGFRDAPEGDMHAAFIARSGWHFVGQRVGTWFLWVNKAYSRGSVELASPDAREEPKVDFRLLSDDRDMERLKIGFRLGAKTLTDPLMKGWAGPVFPTSYSPRVAKIAGGGILNSVQRGLFGAMLDYAGPLRPALIHGAVTLGTKLDDLLRDDQALTAFLGAGVGGVWHASGTARMGSRADPLAVTDGQGRVHGVQNLRVCDASLMPTIPRANTNIPTIMMAERIADLVKQRTPSTAAAYA
jgi:5-(hydroxymethyl)furfural/furfural oxidase